MKPRISLVQMDMAFADPDFNYPRVVELLKTAMEESPDIIVLPETWNVGFFPTDELRALADVDGARTKAVIGGFAAENNVNIVAGSVASLRGDDVYNTCYVFDREGTVVAEYDKVHGFTPFDEHQHFTGGDHTVNFELDGVKCSAVICYDLRFPELFRTSTLKGVDLFFIPAQWPIVRKNHWITLVTARAIENQMYVAAVNSAGIAGETKYGGHSLLISPWGEEILHLGEEEEIASHEIDMDVIAGIRSSINVFRDRRPEIYDLQ